jgi:uncharacterized membrane protein
MKRNMKPGRSTNPHKFFSAPEKKKIVEAIKMAEKQTSGEIRLRLEKRSRKPVMDRAVQVFNNLEMGKTALKNGVLIYLATASHEFVILGDSGINQAVQENFWNDVADRMSQFFKEDKFCDGVCEGITMIGEKLKIHFPYLAADRDELSNEISIQD